ncbi:MAG: FAD-dependent oxidoreductase, partial [Pseudomonadota bacterium]
MSGTYDVIVVGGGLIGAVAALGLAGAGRRVALVDRARPESQPGRLGMDIRNIACSPASRELLESVVSWDALDAASYDRMVVWEELGTAAMTFTAQEARRRELGWILENGPTLQMLWSAIEANDRIEPVFGRVTAIEATEKEIQLTLDSAPLTGRLLLGVDGARSTVRELVNARQETLPTGQSALATVIRTAREHNNTAYQRFRSEGPLALLPGRDPTLSSVVWSQTPEQAA